MTLIIVQRSGALGDVILTTPVIRRLRRENHNACIGVATGYPDVFKHSLQLGGELHSGDITHLINLDLAYEKRPDLHIAQAYMQEAFGDLGNPRELQQELFFPRQQVFEHTKRCVALHATVAGWGNRTLPRVTWRAVAEDLRKAGLWPVLVGTERDDIPDCDVTRFFSYDLLAQANFISRCCCFVGSDSGLLHAAGATDVPIVGVFTCASPETRLPWRYGVLGDGCRAVVPEISCVGCLHRRQAPVTTEYCERGDNACVGMVRPEAITEAVVALAQ